VRLLNATVPETVIKDSIARGLLAAEAVTLYFHFGNDYSISPRIVLSRYRTSRPDYYSNEEIIGSLRANKT
jgi:hypothetical protein